ncbi:MAG: hypothetical protein ACOCZQ_00270 [Nanoarchaeota archaeon]
MLFFQVVFHFQAGKAPDVCAVLVYLKNTLQQLRLQHLFHKQVALHNFFDSGIKSRNDIVSIIPAANASRLYISLSEGFFKTPIAEPIIGPIKEIKTIKYNKFIESC